VVGPRDEVRGAPGLVYQASGGSMDPIRVAMAFAGNLGRSKENRHIG
jgi:hypothetical protein